MTRLQPYSLSACRLTVTSSNKTTPLSGIWIRGANRDVILTVSHFKKDTKTTASTQNTTAEAFTTMLGDSLSSIPSVKCKLVHDFNDPAGKQDFAIFTPCSCENARSPAQSVTIGNILTEAKSLSGLAISFGYNTVPVAPQGNHSNLNVQDCACKVCWYVSGLAANGSFDVNPTFLHPDELGGGCRTISVGEWRQSQNRNCHTVTGWYGISGAGMYANDDQGQLRLVALFQRGICTGQDSDKNGAVIIPRDVYDMLIQAGIYDV